MKEKLLALLAVKFSGARKDVLTHIAAILSCQVADETQAQALVDGFTAEQVTEITRNYRAEVDREISTGNRTHEENLKKKFDFVEKKANDPAQGGDVSTMIKNAVLEAVKPLQEKLSSFESGNTMNTRKQSLEAKLANVNPVFKDTILGSFQKMQFETEDEFNEYLTDIETKAASFIQEEANQSLGRTSIPPRTTNTKLKDDEVSPEMSDYLAKTAKTQ